MDRVESERRQSLYSRLSHICTQLHTTNTYYYTFGTVWHVLSVMCLIVWFLFLRNIVKIYFSTHLALFGSLWALFWSLFDSFLLFSLQLKSSPSKPFLNFFHFSVTIEISQKEFTLFSFHWELTLLNAFGFCHNIMHNCFLVQTNAVFRFVITFNS